MAKRPAKKASAFVETFEEEDEATDYGGDDYEDADYLAGREEALVKVTNFLETMLAKGTDFESAVDIRLTHSGQTSTAPVRRFLYGPDDDLSVKATEIVNAACEDAESLNRRRVSYIVTIEKKIGRVTFTLETQGPNDDDAPEPPNEKGLVAAAQSHAQHFMGAFKGMHQNQTRWMMQIIEQQAHRIRFLEGQQIQTAKAYSELLDNQHVRNLEFMRIEKAEARKEEILDFARQALPAALAKLTGAKIEPNHATPIELLLAGFAKTITGEQLQEMSTTGIVRFSEAQRAGFIQMLEHLVDKIEPEKTNGVSPQGAGASYASPHVAGGSP